MGRTALIVVDMISADDHPDAEKLVASALDAHIRGVDVVVARDAVAHIDAELARAALVMMERNMQAQVENADEIELG